MIIICFCWQSASASVVERVAEEVKSALKPYFVRSEIDKEEYKDIMRKAVPKVSGLRTCLLSLQFVRVLCKSFRHSDTVKPVFFACPLFREFREPDKFTKITGLENLNTVSFQCSRKHKHQNYWVQNN